ncbi:DUF397 domain-containing protein [Nocardiopsis sp. CNR-923]
MKETPKTVEVRDTQNRNLGHLSFAPTEWASFLQDLKGDNL